MFESAGVDVEFIQAGRDKTFGNQFEPLTDESRAYFQGLVDHAYQQFTGNVAAGRGIDAAAVQGEQFGLGRVLTAEAAKKAGMVDAIRTMDQTLAAYGAPAPTGDRQRRALALNILELG
jgi:protease-4